MADSAAGGKLGINLLRVLQSSPTGPRVQQGHSGPGARGPGPAPGASRPQGPRAPGLRGLGAPGSRERDALEPAGGRFDIQPLEK